MFKSLIAALDFTERKRAVNELRKNEVRLEEAQRIAHFGWWERDFSTNRVLLSDELCRIFGVQPADIPEWHQRWLHLIHPEDRSRVAEAATTALRKGPRYDVEYRVVRPDGAVRVVHSRGDVTWDDAGRPLRQFGVLQDITELRRAERELRASEARFRTFVDHAMDAFFLLDDRLTVIDVNRQACDSLGYSREELLGMQPRDFDVGLDEASIKHLSERIAESDRLTFETRHRRKDGTSFPVEIHAAQFEQGGRKHLTLVRDITERKRAEDDLRASEERFRTLVHFSFDVYWETDAQHRFIREEFVEGLAATPAPGSDIGKTPWELPEFEASEEDWRRYRETLDAHLPFRDFELARSTPDGGKRYVSASGTPVFDDKGQFLGYRGVGRDITERKQAEVDIRESEQRFRTLFEKANDAIFVENERDEIVEVNERACALLGYSRQELLTMKVSDLRAPEMRGQVMHRSGHRVLVEVTNTPIFDQGQKLVLSVVRDVTERKRAAEALQQMHEQLTHANRVATMGQLTASIAHEIAQPIGAVYNRANAAINFLNKDPPDLEEVREAISGIAGAADRAREIIGRIRDQVKKAPPRKDIFDLNQAIEEVLLLAGSTITKDAIVVQADFAKDLPPVRGDRVQLQQVALNLILNAVEAMRSVDDGPRELQISTEHNETGDVLVTVCDTGPGVTPENLERVFESFFTTKSSGVGIGLSICRSILEGHGGSLWANANEPRGARFQFTLPGTAADG